MTTPSGSIALVTSDPQLGQLCQFSCIVQDLHGGKGSQPRIQVMAYQDGVLVYGVAGDAFRLWKGQKTTSGENGEDGFLLGGGSSQWLTNGGPAHCVATLYYWSYAGQQKFNPLAPPIEFDAGG